jgi:hypothetical protein
MTITEAQVPFEQSPLGVALISFVCIALLAITSAALKIILQITKMQATLDNLAVRISDLERDPDIMRWSNYGRATQALQTHGNPQGGMT